MHNRRGAIAEWRFAARCSIWLALWAAVPFWLAAPAPALCPLNLNVQIGDRTVDFEFETDEPATGTKFRVKLGHSAADLSFQSRVLRAKNAVRANRYVPLTGLAPSTTYYIDPQVSDVNAATWSDAASCEAELCPSLGLQPGGYTCEDIGAGELRPKVTTLALDAPAQRLPAPPIHDIDPSIIPSITGSTFNVTVDSEGLCTDFQVQLAACAAADPNLNHQVLIPAGATCRPESEGLEGYETPHKSGTGTCVIRTEADPLLLPPPGVRIDPGYRAHMAAVETNRASPGFGFEELVAEKPCATPPCTQGWRFEAIAFQHPRHEDLVRRRLDIVSVDTSTGVITTSEAHGYKFFEVVQVNAPGIHDLEFHRACRVSVAPGVDTFRCFGKAGGLSGSYSGGGSVTTAVSVPLTGCTAGAPVICTTSEPHGFGNYHSFPISSISEGVVTAASSLQIRGGSAVLIEGTPGGAWDGIFGITNVTASSGTLTGAPAGVCNPCSGAIRQLGMVSVQDVRGLGEANVNRAHLSTVIDGTQIRLEQSQASGWLSGGFVSYDPPLAHTMFRFANSRRIVFDRCVFDLRGAPYRQAAVFNWVTGGSAFRTSSAVINSWTREDNVWFGVNPVTKIAVDTGLTVFSSTGFVHQLHRTRDFQLANNMFEANMGIPVFADSNAQNPEDLSFLRNVFWSPERLLGGRAEARGRFYLSRHHLELKAAKRAVVRGNFFRGNAANGSPSGAPVLLSLTNALSGSGSDRTLRDITIEYNTLHENGGFLDIGGSGDFTTDTKSPQRIRIAQNLGVDVDAVRFRAFPAGQAGTQANGWPLTVSPFIGRTFLSYAESEDLRVERNTVLPTFGHGPYVWLATGEASGGTVVGDNIVSFSRASIFQYGLVGDTNNTTYIPPPPSNSGFPFWQAHYRQGPGVPDPLAVWDNVMLPCTDFAEDLDKNATLLRINTMASFAAQHFACNGGCPASFANQIVGADGLHCRDREQELFGSSTDFRLPGGSPYAGYGVELDTLRNEQGRVYDVSVTPTASSATLTYRAPDAAACHVDFGPDKLFSTPMHSRLSDGGGAVQRSVELTGLSSLTTYHFRILCQSDQPRGVFLTQPGGPG